MTRTSRHAMLRAGQRLGLRRDVCVTLRDIWQRGRQAKPIDFPHFGQMAQRGYEYRVCTYQHATVLIVRARDVDEFVTVIKGNERG